MQVTLTHPNPTFTGVITVKETVVLSFTNGTASEDVPPDSLNAIADLGILINASNNPNPPYDANLDAVVAPIVQSTNSSTNVALRAAFDARYVQPIAVTPQVAAALGYAIVTDPQFGAKGDVKQVTDAVVTSGSTTVTSASGGFAGGTAGQYVILGQAGTASTATLSAGLSTGAPITSLPVTALAADVISGPLVVTSGGNTQTFTTRGAPAGATSIPLLNATTPNFAYPTSSTLVGPALPLVTTLSTVSGDGKTVTIAATPASSASAVESRFGTDDSAAIQAAINSLPARGGTVWFPNKGFIVATQLTVNKNSVALAGAAAIRYRNTGDTATSGGGTCLHGVTPGMTVLNWNTTGGLLFGGEVARVNIQDEVVSSCTLVKQWNVNHFRALNSGLFHGAVGWDVHNDTNLDSSWGELVGMLFANNKIGLQVGGSGAVPMVHLSGGTFLVGLGGRGIKQTSSCYYNRYDGAKFDVGAGGVGVEILSGRSTSLTGLKMELYSGGDGIYIGTTDGAYTPPSSTSLHGVAIRDDNVPFSQTGIYVRGPAGGSTKAVSIVGCSVQASIGIRFGANTYGCTVVGGDAEASPTWVQFDSGANRHRVFGGGAVSNSGAIVDNGTGNRVYGYASDGASAQPLARGGDTGSPEGIVAAKPGSIYTRSDGGSGTTLYVKESGTGNTGWTGIQSAGAAGTFDRRAVSARVADTGIQAETFPRWACNGGSTTVAGTVYVSRITLTAGTYGTVSIYIGSASSTDVANWYIGVYDATSNARLAVSADLSSALKGGTGLVTASLPCTIGTTGDYYMALLVGSATTVPAVSAGAGAGSGMLALAPAVATVHTTTGQTSLPATLTPGTLPSVSGVKAFWFRYE